jgi:hypothetical protein
MAKNQTVRLLQDERTRLETVVAEAASAKKRIEHIDKLIALYAGIENGTVELEYQCSARGCGRTFASEVGLARHRTRTHGR